MGNKMSACRYITRDAWENAHCSLRKKGTEQLHFEVEVQNRYTVASTDCRGFRDGP